MSKCYDNPEYDKRDNNLQNTWKQSTYIEPKQEGYICPHTKIQCDDECCVSAEDCHITSSLASGTVDCEEPKQEQQKQHLINMMYDDEELGLYEEPKQETKCYCGHTTYCDCGPLEEPKQEIEKL